MKQYITVSSDLHERADCPVSIFVPELSPGNYQLIASPDAIPVPAFAVAEENGSTLYWICVKMCANETIRYELVKAPDTNPACTCTVCEDRVQICYNGRFYTEFYHGSETVKPYLGPIFSENGDRITRLDFQEKEHVHHRSIWISHGNVNGVDTWNEKAGVHGRIRNHEICSAISSDVLSGFTACNTWTDYDGKPLLEERTAYRFYNTSASGRLFDIDITLTAAYGDVTLGETKEAGPLGVRVNNRLRVDETGTMVNGCGGINEGEIWMKRAPWCDYYGVTDGRTCGIALFDNPENIRYPSWWHARNYGLFATNNYFKGGAIEIPANESVTFRYRLYAHSGNTVDAQVAQRFADYAYAPSVQIGAE